MASNVISANPVGSIPLLHPSRHYQLTQPTTEPDKPLGIKLNAVLLY